MFERKLHTMSLYSCLSDCGSGGVRVKDGMNLAVVGFYTKMQSNS